MLEEEIDHGTPLMIHIGESILKEFFPSVTVVVEGYRHIFILDQSFSDGELGDNILFYLSIYSSGWFLSFVFNREAIMIFSVDLEQLEEPSSGNLQYLQDILEFYLLS